MISDQKESTQQEVLNIHTASLQIAVTALNNSNTIKEAATKLGIHERTLHKWKRSFMTVVEIGVNKYYSLNEPKCVENRKTSAGININSATQKFATK